MHNLQTSEGKCKAEDSQAVCDHKSLQWLQCPKLLCAQGRGEQGYVIYFISYKCVSNSVQDNYISVSLTLVSVSGTRTVVSTPWRRRGDRPGTRSRDL